MRKLAEGISEDEQVIKIIEDSFEKCPYTQDLDLTSNTECKIIDHRDVSKENFPRFAADDIKFDLKSTILLN